MILIFIQMGGDLIPGESSLLRMSKKKEQYAWGIKSGRKEPRESRVLMESGSFFQSEE